MPTHGQPGGGMAHERQPAKVGSTKRIEGGSWIAIMKGRCASIVKL